MNYTEQEIEQWKEKAAKWDALEKEVEAFYIDKDGNPLPDEEMYNLDIIGEVAAAAFGFM